MTTNGVSAFGVEHGISKGWAGNPGGRSKDAQRLITQGRRVARLQGKPKESGTGHSLNNRLATSFGHLTPRRRPLSDVNEVNEPDFAADALKHGKAYDKKRIGRKSEVNSIDARTWRDDDPRRYQRKP